MFTALILAPLFACSGDTTDLPPPPTGTHGTSDTGTTNVPTDSGTTGKTDSGGTTDSDTGPEPDPLCAEFNEADTTVTTGEGQDALDSALVVADGVPVWLDGSHIDGQTVFKLDMNGSSDVALFYTERAVDEIQGLDLGVPIDPHCVDHDFPCEGMSTMRLKLSSEGYAVALNRWPEPIWFMAVDAGDAPTCE